MATDSLGTKGRSEFYTPRENLGMFPGVIMLHHTSSISVAFRYLGIPGPLPPLPSKKTVRSCSSLALLEVGGKKKEWENSGMYFWKSFS